MILGIIGLSHGQPMLTVSSNNHHCWKIYGEIRYVDPQNEIVALTPQMHMLGIIQSYLIPFTAPLLIILSQFHDCSTWFCSPAKQLITHRGHSPKTTLLHRQAISGLQTDPGNDARSSGNCSRFPDSIAFPVSPFLCSHLSLWMWTLPPATRRTALFSRAEDFFAWIGETKTTDASDRIRWSHSSGRETCRSCKAKAEKVCCEGRLNLESLYTSSIKKASSTLNLHVM